MFSIRFIAENQIKLVKKCIIENWATRTDMYKRFIWKDKTKTGQKAIPLIIESDVRLWGKSFLRIIDYRNVL